MDELIFEEIHESWHLRYYRTEKIADNDEGDLSVGWRVTASDKDAPYGDISIVLSPLLDDVEARYEDMIVRLRAMMVAGLAAYCNV